MSQLVQHSQFTQLGDYYKITVYSQVAPCEISVAGRLRSSEGEFSNFDHRVNVTATGLQTIFRPTSGAWWIMSCVASVVSGTVNPGDILIKVELTQGQSPNNVPHQVLLFGSPDSFAPLTMGSPGEFSVDGRKSRIRRLSLPDPATNEDFNYTVPAGVVWQCISSQHGITTAAVTGAATFYLSLRDPGSQSLWNSTGEENIGPGTTRYLIAARSDYFRDNGASAEYHWPVPIISLFPGGSIYQSWTTKTGDLQLSDSFVVVEETILGF
jgi:hypothetical protein